LTSIAKFLYNNEELPHPDEICGVATTTSSICGPDPAVFFSSSSLFFCGFGS
jgi:hypothetical protein